jgi:hypothetical protein
MKTKLSETGIAEYAIPLNINAESEGSSLDLNQFLESKFALNFTGEINCVSCNRPIKKSFNQGYCYPCFQNLAECDLCIVKPELCHFDEGTCRDSNFAMKYCNIPHSIYISLTSSVKVGITRGNNEIHRWIDQGAVRAQRLLLVKRRKFAGLIEVELAKSMKDKTDWRKMLKNEYEEVKLAELKPELLNNIQNLLKNNLDIDDAEFVDLDTSELEISYPVIEFPKKVTSFNLDKDPNLEGTLLGIKGQYLILDTGVINIRKYAGYKISLKIN